jgi:hypothetical protein
LAHTHADGYFGGVSNTAEIPTYLQGKTDSYTTQDWKFKHLGATFEVKKVLTPVPPKSLPDAYKQGHIIDIQKVK